MTLPLDKLVALGSIATRNDLYRRIAPGLAFEAAQKAVGKRNVESIGCLITSSCTGYSIPGWGLDLVDRLGLPETVMRVPITEAGCAAGAVAMTWASHYLRSHCDETALAVSTELCSLSFRGPFEDDNLFATLLFGDGAGAAFLESGSGPGLEILATHTYLVPGSRRALGFDLTDFGFRITLSRQLPEILGPHLAPAVNDFLGRNDMEPRDIDAWLIHPGGPRILETVESQVGSRRDQMRWSWQSMAEFGNTSSASIYDVLRRYIEEDPRPGERALLAAFGPGVSLELMLLVSAS
jgi:alkylresorcinol/alkylpyrone synthase